MSDSWILCVDDEPKVLEGLDLQLGFDYDVKTAEGGEAGLELLRADPNCATIISDMRMPGMDGAQFLAAAREVSPDATRMLLTGFTDLDAAVAAINKGGIFRFMTKPTDPDTLMGAVADGVRQWELIRSEQVLLDKTLHGAAEALVEALEIASPAAFSRSRRLESASRHVATELGLDDVWAISLAGLMFRLGWVAVPTETIENHMAGRDLDAAETTMLDDSYQTAVRLVSRIPRLDLVADIIADAQKPATEVTAAAVVSAVADFDHRCHLGHGAANSLKALTAGVPKPILMALASWDGANEDAVQKDVMVHELIEGMYAETDIVSASGGVLVRSGTEITETVVQRLRNFANSQGVVEPVTVSVRSR